MSNTNLHKAKGKYNSGAITKDELPMNVKAGFWRHNFDGGRIKSERVERLSRINQESEISDMMETNLREAGIMLTGGYDKPFINNIK